MERCDILLVLALNKEALTSVSLDIDGPDDDMDVSQYLGSGVLSRLNPCVSQAL